MLGSELESRIPSSELSVAWILSWYLVLSYHLRDTSIISEQGGVVHKSSLQMAVKHWIGAAFSHIPVSKFQYAVLLEWQ